MKTVLVAVNCSYNHTSLAVPCLQAACRAWAPSFPVPVKREFHIRQDAAELARELAGERPDVIGFSCYIFNISIILEAARMARTMLPGVTILFGGPEMADGGQEFIGRPGGPDYVIRGEGELAFTRFLRFIGGDPSERVEDIEGLTWKRGGKAVLNPPAPPIEPMDRLPSPFAAGLCNFERKFVLLEASRGCPFNCGFCLSGGDRLREFPLGRVFDDIDAIARHSVGEIRFVDRTFNARPERAAAILNYIRCSHPEMRVHVELEPSLLSSRELLAALDSDRVHAEIGLQDLSAEVVRNAGRKPLSSRSLAAVRKLCRASKARIHLDLIAGLPGATLEGLYQNTDVLTGFAPRELQLEVLKALRGTALRGSEAIVHGAEPPYAVILTSTMSKSEIRDARRLSRLVDMFYNDRHLGPVVVCARGLLVRRGGFWPRFVLWWKEEALPAFGIGKTEKFDLLLKFLRTLSSGGDALPEAARARIMGQWVFRRLCHGKFRPRGEMNGVEYMDGGKLPGTAGRLRAAAGAGLPEDRLSRPGAWCIWRFAFDPCVSGRAARAADYVWVWDNPNSPSESFHCRLGGSRLRGKADQES